MRLSKSLAVFACIIACVAGLYITYETTRAESVETMTMPARLKGLGDLLNPPNDVGINQLNPQNMENLRGEVQQSSPFADAAAALEAKGLLWDYSTEEAFIVIIDAAPLHIYCLETIPVNCTYGVFLYARDELGNTEIWYMITNIGQKSIMGTDPTISTIPVYTWANGMPVYFVSVYHWFGQNIYSPGWWVPYHYWWHNSHNHPNWYYSYYNHWWWYHYWYDYPYWGFYRWYPWSNWYYCWFYWRYFNYWSTHFLY